ncbi:MAG: HlyD family type I secretion periplasmic adaptor subunit [Thiobacillaceae bacterium]
MAESSPVLSADALEFAPGLLSIQESPPRRLPRTVLYAVVALLLITAAWMVFGRLDIIASAEGRLVPRTYVKIVQPADAGIVEQIMVQEGQHVNAGQVLMRMDTQIADADTKSIRSELTLRSLQLRRIDAELGGHEMARQPGDPDDLYRQIDSQLHDHRQAHIESLSQAQEALHKAQHDYEAAQEELIKIKEVTPILKQQADAYENLGKDGYAPQVTVRDKSREYLEKAQDLNAQQDTVASQSAAVEEARRNLAGITSKYRSDLQNERVDAEGNYRKLQQDSAKQEHKNQLLELRASQDGIVKDLATHTPGTVVSPGTVLLSLVPDSEALVAEVSVKNDDVGFVYPHQKVKIKLAAYPFQKYGMLDGEVLTIGPDASDANATQTPSNRDSSSTHSDQTPPQLTYKALVALSGQTLHAQGEDLKLVSGMQVTAEINQGKRSVLEYLFSPIQKTLQESGRER